MSRASVRAASWVRINHDDDSRLHDFVTADGFTNLRNWQEDCYQRLRNAQYSLVCTPTGAGKTTALAAIIAHKMLEDKSKKTIIVVPQFSIAKGFLCKQFCLPTGEKITIEPYENLAFDTEAKSDRLIEWISRKKHSRKDLNDRILVCCTATFVNAISHIMRDRNRRKTVLSNLITVLDEAHHARNDDINDETNQLGSIVHSLYEMAQRKEIVENQIIMATATFYRGDKCQIISDEMKQSFQRYDMAWDTWLSQMNHLKSFTYQYVFESPLEGYFGGMERAIDDLFDSGKRKLIIYLPQVNSIFDHFCSNKYEQVKEIVNILAKKTKSKVSIAPDGLIVLRSGKNQYKILDLVDERNRKKKKEFFEHTDINADKDAIDCVIALNMFTEGSDWQHADGMVITGYRDSLTDLIQRIGRVLRDSAGKDTAKIVQILPFDLMSVPNEGLKDTLNNRYKTLASAMLMEDFFNNIEITTGKSKLRPNEAGKRTSVFDTLYLDENDLKNFYVKIAQMIHEKAIELHDYSEGDRASIIRGLMTHFSKKILNDHNVKLCDDDYSRIGGEVWRKFCRHKLVSDGVDMSRYDWNMIDEVDPVGHMLKFVSQPTDGSALTALRSMLDEDRVSQLELAEKIRQLSKMQTEMGISRKPRHRKRV